MADSLGCHLDGLVLDGGDRDSCALVQEQSVTEDREGLSSDPQEAGRLKEWAGGWAGLPTHRCWGGKAEPREKWDLLGLLVEGAAESGIMVICDPNL